jgi:hypothetical protein
MEEDAVAPVGELLDVHQVEISAVFDMVVQSFCNSHETGCRDLEEIPGL